MLALLFPMMFCEVYPMRLSVVPVDIPAVHHAASIEEDHWEDVPILAVARDGNLYLGNSRVWSTDLPKLLRDFFQYRLEKIVYIKADTRAKYGAVKAAIDAIREAGVSEIIFLTETARS